MNIKTILFAIGLCASVPIYCFESDTEETTLQHVELEPTKRTVHWVHWCLKHATRGISDPELIENRDLYIQLLKQHIAKLERKGDLIDLISSYKWKKGCMDLKAGALTIALASLGYYLAKNESVIKSGHTDYYNGLFALSLFATPFTLLDAFINISKSISYKEHLEAKLERDRDALALLEQLP